jgi:putative effector of murein hydrolase
VIDAILWSVVTVAAYLLAQAVSRRFGDPPWLQPVATSTLMVIAILVACRVPYVRYAHATVGISFLLAPATIALAVPLYRQLAAIRRNALAVGTGIACGSLTVIVSVTLIAHALGCDDVIVRSLAPKSVTVPVAMAVSGQIGGAPALTAVFAVMSGILGAMLAPYALRFWPEHFAGIGIGTTSHGIGTARLYALSRAAAGFSGLAMGGNAILTAVFVPPLAAAVETLLAR